MGVGSSSTRRSDTTKKKKKKEKEEDTGVEVSDVDRAVLKLKTQIKKLERQYNGARSREEAERKRAREFMSKTRNGKEKRDTTSARNALKKAAALGKLADNLAAMQMQVQSMLVDIDAAARDRDTLRALSCGNEALRTLQQEFGVDRAEEVLREYDEAKDAMMSWGLTLSAEEQGDVDSLEEELEKMQKDIEREEEGGRGETVAVDAENETTTNREPEQATETVQVEEPHKQEAKQEEEEEELRLPNAPTHALPVVDATAAQEEEEENAKEVAPQSQGRVAMLAEPA